MLAIISNEADDERELRKSVASVLGSSVPEFNFEIEKPDLFEFELKISQVGFGL